jgi:hypothetical protein
LESLSLEVPIAFACGVGDLLAEATEKAEAGLRLLASTEAGS